MKIDRSNYEIWFIDWVDNNLDQSQLDELTMFLDQNPDLKNEFNEFVEIRLVNEDIKYASKNNLRRSASELSPEQFEYLCAAFFENDLTEQQKDELMVTVTGDREKSKTFEAMGRLRLKAPSLQYSGKKALLRKTAFEKAVRISWITLAAAAAVAAFVVTYPLIRNNGEISVSPLIAEKISRDSVLIEVPEKITKKAEATKSDPLGQFDKKPAPVASTEEIKEKPAIQAVKEDLSIQKVEMVAFQANIALADLNQGNSLIESASDFNPPYNDDGRSKIGKFIARNFREKILRQKEVSDAPLKGYELAEAGIEGLNKLLGWQMALDTKSDENGEVESVRFNSKMLKFSAPVKKSESAE
jgi:hypothetical protein